MTMQTLPMTTMTTGQTMVALAPPPQASFPIRVPQPAHTPAAALGRSGAAFSPLIPLAGIQVRNGSVNMFD